MATARDGCVVPSEPLSLIVCGFVSDWKRDRPAVGGRFGGRAGRAAKSENAIDYLARQSGLPRGTVDRLARTPPRSKTTELRTADAIITALGMPEAFHDGTLDVFVNPIAKPAARAECRRCGGRSMLGVGY